MIWQEIIELKQRQVHHLLIFSCHFPPQQTSCLVKLYDSIHYKFGFFIPFFYSNSTLPDIVSINKYSPLPPTHTPLTLTSYKLYIMPLSTGWLLFMMLVVYRVFHFMFLPHIDSIPSQGLSLYLLPVKGSRLIPSLNSVLIISEMSTIFNPLLSVMVLKSFLPMLLHVSDRIYLPWIFLFDPCLYYFTFSSPFIHSNPFLWTNCMLWFPFRY